MKRTYDRIFLDLCEGVDVIHTSDPGTQGPEIPLPPAIGSGSGSSGGSDLFPFITGTVEELFNL